MRVALSVKNKLGFVNGTCVKGSYKGELETQWERCNAIVVSWLSSTVASELVPSIMYASSAKKDLWDELDILGPLPSCDREESRSYVEHLVRQRLLQFLMGLNESYSPVRNNILLRRPVLSVN
ncbi:uncharacterized protein [Nicotiana tomentosiformis]|uniref:uncharacterized protein n=1 Tax=Nicotiana tomentosiformis TaxID=4098 RepID=UPI00388CC6A7